MTTNKIVTLSAKVRQKNNLNAAWRHIRSNAMKSSSSETIREVDKFEIDLTSNLDRIERELRNGKFKFPPSRGVAVKKPGKSTKRPLVIAPIKNRVVQRAILNVLQAIPQISSTLKSGFNFGGVEGKNFGVPAAVKKAFDTAKTSKYFIRTDIKSFFVNVPREKALQTVLCYSDDPVFNELARQATVTELDNLASLSPEEQRIFPLYDEGVAQGSCLSPLLCNMYLAEFDRAMNERGIVCIRYIDDFILFGPNKKFTKKAFDAALAHLERLGLTAYNPEDSQSKGKAEEGDTEAGFEFLGCHISPSSIIPAKKNRQLLLIKIENIFSDALMATASPRDAIKSGKSYGSTVRNASNTVQAWGNTFSFCNDERIMNNLDEKLHELFTKFNIEYRERIQAVDRLNQRRLLGFHSLKDCKKDGKPS